VKKQKTMAFVFLFVAAGMLFLTHITVPVVAQEIKRAMEIERRLIPITGDEGDRAVDLDIRFSVNQAKLTDAARRQLTELGRALNSEKLAGARFEINGHTDASGKAAYNKALSLKRAKSVRDFLVKFHAVKTTRLVVHGYGEERLKNALEPKAVENRRVEIIAKHERRDPPARNEGGKKGWGVIQ
jgi:outer membrane protein OmpA-like peptidoglycan-associated protein